MTPNHARTALFFTFAPGAGPVLFKRCMEKFKTVDALWNASPFELAQIEQMPRTFVEAWKNREPFLEQADRELELAGENGILLITLFDPEYPEPLRAIYDPPIALYVKGRLAPTEKIVAMVGSRKTSAYGDQTAREFARDFARADVTVVSGLALGIDSAAHRGAMDGGGVTWAVLGGGLLNPGSYRRPKLAEEIVETGGAILSEYLLNQAPRPEYYPMRNRIVSGLSSGVVVIEAGRQSGALITAGLALEQGRDVFAVPGNVSSLYSEGSNWLLRQGAKPVCSAADVLDYLGFVSGNKPAARLVFESLSELERKMIGILSPKQATHVDDRIERSGQAHGEALSLIGTLVLKGAVSERPGKYFIPEKH